MNFDWPAKRNVLLGYYEPTDDEKRFIAESSPKPIFAGPVNHRRLRVLYRCQYPHTSIATSNHAYQQIALWSGVFGVDFSDDPANALRSRQY
ncbi:hypothetical protein [Aporhodopirellula aestuarii]|uniref:hypothetical protein n=1 Tax=Aporhodopirellula aestuarii TaxID=2950107 RepID=UPI002034936F|nr:hypothetical protein [Aporhodopirellula aestuarii]